MMAKNHRKKLKVENAYFQEKSFVNLTKLRFTGASIRPEDRFAPGEHKIDSYIYAETGMLFCSLQGKVRRLRNATLIYSNDDVNESVKNISDFCNSLVFKKLHQKSRSGMTVFDSKCDLCYTSKSTRRIKNFLVCIDGAKKGYDLFIIQTLQSPLGKYTSSFSIDENGNVTKYDMSIPTTFTKRGDTGITNRIVMLDDLDSMMKPFFVNGVRTIPSNETESFKSFISSFKASYEFWQTNLSENGKIYV
ncbi:hypothetical protein [Limosilactobacillus fastidiosus]|uniref:Uncharacterized protein n=2 Tax=Limosilactobacillus fastidiosus TaxID=2759855 RepID=A0A7W3TZ90_9LACO|nr:hypothetical protein [Limosilactobacillus fastidiosus]MBB1086033.1 hypothetical protein [Limosilactobacillus fastidiosus]MCD7114162.1 hypothetical protein [Limosilactobacillus fastidiosus]MCD7116704.1 hypothetical protein [Limosilactobacillus fastidiosus]